MYYAELIDKYRLLCKKFNLDIFITLVHGEEPIQRINENHIYLNIEKIKHDKFEIFLSYNIRKILLPKLILQTERLILRRFEYNDVTDIFAIISDRDTCYSDGGYEPYTEMNQEFNDLMDKFYLQETRYMIELKEEKKVIGFINLFGGEDRVVEALEIGYIVSPDYRRKGYAYEAVKAMSDLLLKELHLDLLVAGAIASNVASNQLLKKLKFSFEGKRTKAFYHPVQGPIDLLYYIKERKKNEGKK